MKTSDAFPGKYLGAADVASGPMKRAISSVQREDVDGADKIIMRFKFSDGNGEDPRGMVLNKTNWKAAVALHGDDSDDWVGCEVELYQAETFFNGDTVPCIRLRG